MEGVKELRIKLRPKVGMGFYQALPVICSLGISDGVPGSGVAWPHGVVSAAGESVAEVRVRGGYDEEGMFADLSADLAPETDVDVVRAALIARVDSWAGAISRGAAAGPLAPVLSELFDRMPLMGRQVLVTYPNGRPLMRGALCGIDVWGRATVRDASGREAEFAPEQVRILPA